ncbi:hypothetical protein ACROYT_G014299 [Oculina patagonica]
MPRMQIKFQSFNDVLKQTQGRVSPEGSQLNTNVESISSSTRHYYTAVEMILDAKAPKRLKWLLQQVLETYSHSTDLDVTLSEKTLLTRLIILSSEATNWTEDKKCKAKQQEHEKVLMTSLNRSRKQEEGKHRHGRPRVASLLDILDSIKDLSHLLIKSARPDTAVPDSMPFFLTAVCE